MDMAFVLLQSFRKKPSTLNPLRFLSKHSKCELLTFERSISPNVRLYFTSDARQPDSFSSQPSKNHSNSPKYPSFKSKPKNKAPTSSGKFKNFGKTEQKKSTEKAYSPMKTDSSNDKEEQNDHYDDNDEKMDYMNDLDILGIKKEDEAAHLDTTSKEYENIMNRRLTEQIREHMRDDILSRVPHCLYPSERLKDLMYKLHICNPKKWSVSALSNRFGLKAVRVMGYLRLRQSEIDLEKAQGAPLDTTVHDLINAQFEVQITDYPISERAEQMLIDAEIQGHSPETLSELEERLFGPNSAKEPEAFLKEQDFEQSKDFYDKGKYRYAFVEPEVDIDKVLALDRRNVSSIQKGIEKTARILLEKRRLQELPLDEFREKSKRFESSKSKSKYEHSKSSVLLRKPTISAEKSRKMRVARNVPEGGGRVFLINSDRSRNDENREILVIEIDGSIRTASWEERCNIFKNPKRRPTLTEMVEKELGPYYYSNTQKGAQSTNKSSSSPPPSSSASAASTSTSNGVGETTTSSTSSQPFSA